MVFSQVAFIALLFASSDSVVTKGLSNSEIAEAVRAVVAESDDWKSFAVEELQREGEAAFGLSLEVLESPVDLRIQPDYTVEETLGFRELPTWLQHFRFPDYGRTNSPSFDEVEQRYWWE